MLLLSPLVGSADQVAVWNGTMYVQNGTTTISWNATNDRETHYEVEGIWLDQRPEQYIDLGQTSKTEMEVGPLRSGHYAFRVRACNEQQCSDWNDSRDGNTNFINAPFRIYQVVPAPSGISID